MTFNEDSTFEKGVINEKRLLHLLKFYYREIQPSKTTNGEERQVILIGKRQKQQSNPSTHRLTRELKLT